MLEAYDIENMRGSLTKLVKKVNRAANVTKPHRKAPSLQGGEDVKIGCGVKKSPGRRRGYRGQYHGAVRMGRLFAGSVAKLPNLRTKK